MAKILPPMDKMTCEELIVAYLEAKRMDGLKDTTLKMRGYALRAFCSAIKAVSPESISRSKVNRWLQKHKESTATNYAEIVHGWLFWLAHKDAVGAQGRQWQAKTLKPEDARKLIDACKEPGLKFALYCGLHAGFRKREVIEAVPEWFDLEAGVIRIGPTPTYSPKPREITLTDEFKNWLKEVYGLPSPFMLVPIKAREQRASTKTRYRYDFGSAFQNLIAKCHLDVSFDDLRRTVDASVL